MGHRRTDEQLLEEAQLRVKELASKKAMKDLSQLAVGRSFIRGMRNLRRAFLAEGDPVLVQAARDSYERLAKVLEKQHGIVQRQVEEASDEPEQPNLFDAPADRAAG